MLEQSVKISKPLAERIRASDGDELLEVMVELRSPSAPIATERLAGVAALKGALAGQLEPVLKRVTAAGGELIDSAWLNQTLMIRIPLSGIGEVARHEAVTSIDLPHEVRPDQMA